MSGKPCGLCGQVRKILPNKVAAYLLDLELKRQAAKKRPTVSLRYTTTTQPEDMPHIHLWSGIDPDAYCVGCSVKRGEAL